MRRATFRMTLESSTTRHVFILGLQLHQIPRGMFSFQLRSSCRHQVRHDFENAIDVEDDHELAVETVNTAGTGEIGSPNNCPPITAVTYSATVPSMVSVLVVICLFPYAVRLNLFMPG